MNPVDAYRKGSNRGEFQWECVETSDCYGMGGVKVEETALKGRTARIIKETENEFEVDVILMHEVEYNKEKTYEIIDYRSSRKLARELAERLIRQDIAKDIKVTLEQMKLMRHMIGLDNEKKPYRNYGYFYKPQSDLEDLVDKGLAIKRDGDKEGHVVYHLTRLGVEYALGKPISDKKYYKL